MASCHTHAPLFPHACTPIFPVYTPLSSASRSSFPFLPHLFSSSYSLLLSSASTDADARIDRRRHPHRPTQTSAPTDADARNDRRRWLLLMFHSAKPLLSQCQTFTFVLPSRCFCGSKPPFLHFILSFSCNIFPCFPQSAVLSCCVHPLVAVLKNSLSRL